MLILATRDKDGILRNIRTQEEVQEGAPGVLEGRERQPWEIARELTDEELAIFTGQIIPWPPSDADVLWWANAIRRLHLLKDRLHPNRKKTTRNWSPTDGRWKGDFDVPGRFGECYFGLVYDLRPHLVAWPKDLNFDYKTAGVTLDIKTSSQPTGARLFLNLSLPELEEKKAANKPLCDIYVCAWAFEQPYSLEKVSLCGWAWKNELLSAKIKEWTKVGGGADAHAIHWSELHPMTELSNLIGQPKVQAGTMQPPEIKKPSVIQKSLF